MLISQLCAWIISDFILNIQTLSSFCTYLSVLKRFVMSPCTVIFQPVSTIILRKLYYASCKQNFPFTENYKCGEYYPGKNHAKDGCGMFFSYVTKGSYLHQFTFAMSRRDTQRNSHYTFYMNLLKDQLSKN